MISDKSTAMPTTSPDRVLFAHDVLEWVKERHEIRITGATAMLIFEIFEHAPDHTTLTTLLDEIDCAKASARFRLNKKLLPNPSRWYQAARALRAAERLRANPELSVTACALECGYSDHSSFIAALWRQFGLNTARTRQARSWEELMERWWERWVLRRPLSQFPRSRRAA